jgi:TRAP-type C4-dicarboxylate transport system substrate-binding protein
VLLISVKWWNRLPDDLKSTIQKAADSSSIYERKLWKERSKSSLAMVEAAGVQINRPDKKPFREKVAPMYKEYNGTEIGKLINQIKAVE